MFLESNIAVISYDVILEIRIYDMLSTTCHACYMINEYALEKRTNSMVLMLGFTKLLKAILHSDFKNTRKLGQTRQNTNISR